MKKEWGWRVLRFFLGLTAWLGILSAIAVSAVTNESLMKHGFLQYAQTAHLGVPASRYGDYAKALVRYLDGKEEAVLITDPETKQPTPAFSQRENDHLSDVRHVVNSLKLFRWIGGGLAVTVIGGLYLFKKKDGPLLLAPWTRGFALAALALLAVFTALAIWGAVNFDGLFITFHKIAFTNDLWLLNPNTDVLMALMPLPFFIWYAGEILKAMGPVLGMMLLVIIAWIKGGKRRGA